MMQKKIPVWEDVLVTFFLLILAFSGFFSNLFQCRKAGRKLIKQKRENV